MLEKVLILCGFLILLTGSVFTLVAQPNRGADRPNTVEKVASPFSGKIQAVNLEIGSGQPSIMIAAGTIQLGPYYFLQQSDLLLEIDTFVEGECFESLSNPGTFLAFWISNGDEENLLELRDEYGRPLWAGSRGFGRGRGNGPMNGGRMGRGFCGRSAQAIDVENVVTLEGEVSNLNLGRCFPSLELETAEGPVTVMVSPYRAWLDSDFTLNEGDLIEVVAFPSLQLKNTFVAKNIVKGEETFEFRGEDGLPLQGRRNCRNMAPVSVEESPGRRQGLGGSAGSCSRTGDDNGFIR
jgi:hypothetical protein